MKRKGLFLAAGCCALIALLLYLCAAPSPAVPVASIGPARSPPQIVVAADHVLVLAPDGSLWTWSGGTGPHQVGTETDWKKIVSGPSAFAGIKTNGTLWHFDYSNGAEISPLQLSSATNWKAVAAEGQGGPSILALKTDGTLWEWQARHSTPVQVDESTNWVAIAAGIGLRAAIQKDGSLWVWKVGPLSTGPPIPARFGNETNWVEVRGAAYELMATKRDGSCWIGGTSSTWLMAGLVKLQRPLLWGEMTRLKEIEDWDSITFGSCALGLKKEGTLHGFGMNWAGVLGSGPYQVRKGPLQITLRRDWVAAGNGGWVAAGLTSDGTLWAWGQRVDIPGRVPKVKQLAANWLQRFGVVIGTRKTTSHPTPILQFRSQITNHLASAPQ